MSGPEPQDAAEPSKDEVTEEVQVDIPAEASRPYAFFNDMHRQVEELVVGADGFPLALDEKPVLFIDEDLARSGLR